MIYKASSGVQSIAMGRNLTHEVLKIDTEKAKFPLLLSFNFVVNTPLTQEEIEQGSEQNEPSHTDTGRLLVNC